MGFRITGGYLVRSRGLAAPPRSSLPHALVVSVTFLALKADARLFLANSERESDLAVLGRELESIGDDVGYNLADTFLV